MKQVISFSSVSLSLFVATSLLGTQAAQAQATKKKPVVAMTKTVATTKPAAGGPIVLGTKQLPGDFGKLGQAYTVGKESPINVTLKSAEYTVEPFNTQSSTLIPKADEKLLVLHYTVHNPLPKEQTCDSRTFRFTAVDASDVNHEGSAIVAREGERTEVQVSLKPAQKLDVVTAIVVPAQGVVPKLILQRETDAPVIRYDLRDKVKPLADPLADTADATGATARAVVPTTAGVFVPIGIFNVRLDGVADTTDTLYRQTPNAGGHFLVATLTMKNPTTKPQPLYGHHFESSLIDTDGEKTAYNHMMLMSKRDDLVGSMVEPGAEAKVRIFFPMPKDATGKTLNFTHGSKGRAVAWDLTTPTTASAQ